MQVRGYAEEKGLRLLTSGGSPGFVPMNNILREYYAIGFDGDFSTSTKVVGFGESIVSLQSLSEVFGYWRGVVLTVLLVQFRGLTESDSISGSIAADKS
mmetsp:Transcript_30880/g.65593  ORF Transcript_30880/g.65593 Transcript_30880/m.65593 type:complete len:99 (+) Transcript_30880:534-830(+)